ncbi:MAG: T9SS type A sorting domain-containing protein [Candidatus Eisenbacteria bacterium]
MAATSDSGYVDPAGAPYYYKLAAIDTHGNLSGFATLLPSGALGVPVEVGLEFSLDPVRPNPVRGRVLTVRFVLTSAAAALLELFDVSGRRVAAREVGALGAGRWTIAFDHGRDLAPGLYVVRLTQGTNVRFARVAMLD